MLVDKPTQERIHPLRSTENIVAVTRSVFEQPSMSTGHRPPQCEI